MVLEPGKALGYRRGAKAGSWIARIYDPSAKPPKRYHALGAADDHADPDGETIFSFSQAQDMARQWFTVAANEAILKAGGEILPSGPLTVAQAVEEYFQDGERRGMKGLKQARSAARVHILPALGPQEVGKLTRFRLEKWLEAVANSPAQKRSKPKAESPSLRHKVETPDTRRARKDTANRILTVLKAALNHALHRRRVMGSGEAWRAVKPYKGTTSARVRFLNVVEQQALVKACPPAFRMLVQAALFTGARCGELGRLLVKDFNPTAGTVFFLGKGTGEWKPRQVVLTQEARDWFQGLCAGRKAEDLLFTRPGVKRRASERKNLTEPEGWLDNDQARPMREACEKAEIDRLSFHELRHTYASGLVNAGVPLVYIAENLGHTNTRMVEKHYGHLAPTAKAEAIRKLAPVLGISEPATVSALRVAAHS